MLAAAKLTSAASAMPRRVISARNDLEDQPIMALEYRVERRRRKPPAPFLECCDSSQLLDLESS